MKTNIFLSYCWNDSGEANKIYDYFKSSQNIELHKDTIDIGKWGSIKEYMQSISNMDYTILLISDSYLKSANCMYEVLEVMRDRNYRDKMFPAVIYSGIYSPITRAKYVKHWQDEFSKLESTLKEINVQNLGKLNEDLKRRQDISSNIAEFLDVVSDMNNPNIEDVCVRIEEKLRQNGFIGNNQISDANDLVEDVDHLEKNKNDQKDGNTVHDNEMPKRRRTKEYADKWDKNVFLNNFNERDENVGVNVKLSQIYLKELLPSYIWKTNANPLCDMEDLLKEYVIDQKEKKMLLILGQPGIGKSTLITWLTANFEEQRENIYVYQFASDLKSIDWKTNNILDKILQVLHLTYDELENKTIILDGFDEIGVSEGREQILNRLYQELEVTNCLKSFSFLITCRENYVSGLEQLRCDYVTLRVWNDRQIQNFCKNYSRVNQCKVTQSMLDKLLEKKEIFGIPLILYMVLALNITIEEDGSVVDIYDRIFSLESGGIYDRCIKNANYGPEHPISEIKRQIHQVSQRIAFWMFEHEPENAFITQREYESICEAVVKELPEKERNIKHDVKIGNYFKLVKHCEGVETEELQFVHRSIYEYFVAVHFFESIRCLATKEEVAGKLGDLLKEGELSDQVLEYIKCKFDQMKRSDWHEMIKDVFQIMLRDGMTYYVKEKRKSSLNIMEQERNIFANMLELVSLWNPVLGKLDEKIIIYLQSNRRSALNLRGIELRYGKDLIGEGLIEANLIGENLIGVQLIEVDLRGAYLSGAYLRGAYLRGADLKGAYLSGADLSGAYLSGADLRGAYLKDAIFDEKQVKLLHKKYDLNDSRVYLSSTKEIISCKEYRKRFPIEK